MASFDEEKTTNKRLLWLIQTVCPNHMTLRTGKQGARFAESGASAAGLKKISFRTQTQIQYKITLMQKECSSMDP